MSGAPGSAVTAGPAMPAGRQLGFLWGGVALALVLLAPLARQAAALLPACPLRTLTGLPCPACGSGGAALALARLDVGGALATSPLAALGWTALVMGGLVAGLAAWRGHALPEWPARMSALWRAIAVTVLLANWAYLIGTR